jgi:Arc/MetJ family transcription regulator
LTCMHILRPMRTTIEIPDELREKLVQEAARLGEKGYSSVVERALRMYFQQTGSREMRRAATARLRGSMTEQDLPEEHRRLSEIRRNWRGARES